MNDVVQHPSRVRLARRRLTGGLVLLPGLAALPPVRATASGELRVGVIASYSGPYADYGRQFDSGMSLYLAQAGGRLAGRHVRFMKRDTAGAAPDLARRYAQELIVRDKVDVLVGLDFSPNALSVGALAAQAEVPVIVMNAAASAITARSPYMVRVSFTIQQVTAPLARWALSDGVREVYTIVADYTSGLDAETAFTRVFTEGGGRIAGSLRTPLSNPDFSAYLQRIRDAKPEAVFFFFPSGVQPTAFLKAWRERGMHETGIRLIATGEATDDSYLPGMGELAQGLVTSHHYSYAHPSPKNRQFVRDFHAAFGEQLRPSYFAVAAYDGMAALDGALRSIEGDVTGKALIQAFPGMHLDSPRGSIQISPETRDIVQTVYIRRVEMAGSYPVNIEFASYPDVVDPAYPHTANDTSS